MSASPRAPSKRAANKAQNRAAIVAAARAVFAELGYDAAGVRDVIGRAGLAAGTFYNYFPDKESVFRAVVQESAQEISLRLRAVRSNAQSLEEFVGDGYRVWFQFIVEYRLIFELMRRNAATIRAVFGDPTLGHGVEELLGDLTVLIERGDLPPHDAAYMAGAMAGVGLELGVRMADRDPPDLDGASRFATDLFLGGIARLRDSPAGPLTGRCAAPPPSMRPYLMACRAFVATTG